MKMNDDRQVHPSGGGIAIRSCSADHPESLGASFTDRWGNLSSFRPGPSWPLSFLRPILHQRLSIHQCANLPQIPLRSRDSSPRSTINNSLIRPTPKFRRDLYRPLRIPFRIHGSKRTQRNRKRRPSLFYNATTGCHGWGEGPVRCLGRGGVVARWRPGVDKSRGRKHEDLLMDTESKVRSLPHRETSGTSAAV